MVGIVTNAGVQFLAVNAEPAGNGRRLEPTFVRCCLI